MDVQNQNRYEDQLTSREIILSPATRPEPDHCECCGGPSGKKELHLDHCHETGQFRGWLCSNCNKGTGMLGDNIEGLQNAVRYLRRYDNSRRQ